MRFVLFFCLIFPAAVHAACDGHDLRPDLSPSMQADLQQALNELPYPQGNHWVASKDGKVLHLIGTFHANDARMDAVVTRLTPVLGKADAFYFEVTQDEMAAFEQGLASDLSPILITSGPTLIDLMPAEDWNALSTRLTERGVPGWMAAKMRPWFLSMMLGIPPCMIQDPDADFGMDARLSDLAKEKGIPQYSLEGIDEVIAIFDSHPIEDQVQSLVRMADALDGSEDQLATMANMYFEEQHGQILQLARLQGQNASDLPEDVFDSEWESFEQHLLIARNDAWMKHILAIRADTAVIAVGAGHLAGTFGLLNQLQAAGFDLTRAAF